jgi:putative ABC transport system ATP-binding protein
MQPSATDSQVSAANNELAIELEQIRFAWPKSQQDTLHISRLAIARKERVFLQGASGSGKTTLLSLLGGVVTPQQGNIRVLGQSVSQLRPADRDSFRADHIGFVFQMFNLIPYLSLVDNVTLPCRFSRKRLHQVSTGGKTPVQEAERLLRHLKLDLLKLGNRPVTDLSVGQQQRVAVARALIGSPELIIADEPTSALDTDARFAFIDLLFKEVELSQSTLMFVSHDASLRNKFDRTIALQEINLLTSQEGS